MPRGSIVDKYTSLFGKTMSSSTRGTLEEVATISEDDTKKLKPASPLISIYFNCDGTNVSKLTTTAFRPTYIHQLFDNETIPGYNSAIDKYKLQIHIYLTPSCCTCRVEYHVWMMSRQSVLNVESNGASNTNNSEDDPQQTTKKRRVVGFALPAKDIEQETPPHLQENKKVMVLEEITNKLQLALPPIVQTTTINHKDTSTSTKKDSTLDSASTTSTNHYGNDDVYLSHPLGGIQKEYQRQYCNETQERTFCLCITEEMTDEVAQYHNQIQPLSLFFIETANCVDVADRNNGFWKVLYVFEKLSATCSGSSRTTTAIAPTNHNHDTTGSDTTTATTAFRYALVGYMTLFYFYSPFRKPTPGYIVRICQILILPHHQRVGHGLQMLRTLYHYVGDDVVEINVEDPSPTFARLRNRMDYERIRQNISEASHTNPANTSEPPRPEDQKALRILPIKYTQAPSITSLNEPSLVFVTLTESDCIKAGQMAKITPIQIHISYEIYKLSVLEEKLKEMHDNETKQRWEKEYRLMVKRRLLRTHKEELGGCLKKEERQQMLENIFQDLLHDYRKTLRINKFSK